MSQLTLTKEFTFAAAHKLPNYKGKCENLHGHTYKLHVTVKGKVQKDGMVIDFHELNDIVKKNVLNKLDHSYLNDVLENPTTENLVVFIEKELKAFLKIESIVLYESPTSFVTLKK